MTASLSTAATAVLVLLAITCVALSIAALVVATHADSDDARRPEHLILRSAPSPVTLMPPVVTGTTAFIVNTVQEDFYTHDTAAPFVTNAGGVFTVQKTGVYQLSSFVRLTKPVIQTRFQIVVERLADQPLDGLLAAETLGGFPDGGPESTSIVSCVAHLRQGDRFYFNVFSNFGDLIVTHGRISIVRFA